MSDIELHDEGTDVLVTYRSSQGAGVKTIAGPVTKAHPTGTGWVMKISPRRDLPTIRLDGRDRGAFVETRRQGDGWQRIGVAMEITTSEVTE